MADWNKPSIDSEYANYTDELRGLLLDLAVGGDPAHTTASNTPANRLRWSSATSRWEKLVSGSWVAAAATYAINVATANAWSAGRTIGITGDVSGTSAAWNGSNNISFALTLANVNANAGSFGSATAVPVITVNAKGLITAVGTANLGNMANQNAATVAITGGDIAGVNFTFKQSPTAAPTAEGRAEWDTDDDLLKIGTGTGTKTQVNTDSAQTLTNKTMGAGSTWAGTAVPVSNGGTGADTAAGARASLDVPSRSGQNASGTWDISVNGNAATSSSAAKLTTARAINGVAFDGTAAITVKAATPANLELASDGSGAAPGTTFDGSVARKISYNSVGAPSTTGNGASGTWGISVSGSSVRLSTTNFTVEEVGGELVFKYGATVIAKLDSAGNFSAKADVKAAQAI